MFVDLLLDVSVKVSSYKNNVRMVQAHVIIIVLCREQTGQHYVPAATEIVVIGACKDSSPKCVEWDIKPYTLTPALPGQRNESNEGEELNSECAGHTRTVFVS